MAGAYTQRFVVYDGVPARVSYVVPAGYRIVVRSIVCWTDTTGTGLTVEVGPRSVWLWASSGAYVARTEIVYIVAYAGEALTGVFNGPRAGGMLAGYIFEDPVGPHGASTVTRLPQHKPADAPRRG